MRLDVDGYALASTVHMSRRFSDFYSNDCSGSVLSSAC
jgi:hypothetical protein